MKNLMLLSILCFGSNAIAGLPSGRFSGFTSSSSFNQPCMITSASVEFSSNTDGSYVLEWQENGHPTNIGSGDCNAILDARLTPTSDANVFDVDFFYDNDLIFGKVRIFNDTRIELTADYNGFGNSGSHLSATFNVNEANNIMNYTRVIDSNFGPSNMAMGTLTR